MTRPIDVLGIDLIAMKEKLKNFFNIMDLHKYDGDTAEFLVTLLERSFTENEIKALAIEAIGIKRELLLRKQIDKDKDMILTDINNQLKNDLKAAGIIFIAKGDVKNVTEGRKTTDLEGSDEQSKA